MYSWLSLQSCKKERKEEKLSHVCFAGSQSSVVQTRLMHLYYTLFCARPLWKAKCQSSQTNLIWICAGLSAWASASVKCLWSVVCV